MYVYVHKCTHTRTHQQVIAKRKLSSAMSAANAIGDHIRTWLVTGTKEGDFASLAITSDGSYGVQKGQFSKF